MQEKMVKTIQPAPRSVDMVVVPLDNMANDIRLIRETMRSKFFIKGIDYDKAPGYTSPDEPENLMLLQAGAQKLLKRFNLYAQRLSLTKSPSGHRVEFEIAVYTIGSNVFVGYGAGVASYQEPKYHWRYALCDEEFEYYQDADPTSVRMVFKKQWDKKKRGWGTPTKEKQVRRDFGEVEHTVFMMAKKRAIVDATKNALAAGSLLKTLQVYKGEPEPCAGHPGEDQNSTAHQTLSAEQSFISEDQYKKLLAAKDAAGMNDDIFLNIVKNVGKTVTPDSLNPKRIKAVMKAIREYDNE